MSFITGVEAVKGISQEVAGIVGSCIEIKKGMAESNFSAENLIRMYYCEVCRDLNFLSLFDAENLKKMDTTSKELKLIVSNLETSAATAILCTEDADETKNGHALKKLVNEKIKISDTDENPSNLIQSVCYTIFEIETLKNIAEYPDPVDLHNFHLAVRLQNLKKRFSKIKIALLEQPALEGFSKQ